jgi:hypothetical protein
VRQALRQYLPQIALHAERIAVYMSDERLGLGIADILIQNSAGNPQLGRPGSVARRRAGLFSETARYDPASRPAMASILCMLFSISRIASGRDLP